MGGLVKNPPPPLGVIITDKHTVRGPVVPSTEGALELAATRTSAAEVVSATRLSEAEILAVRRHQSINLVWEYTQGFIALLCVMTAVGVSAYTALTAPESSAERAYQFITNAGLLVIGFYFGRTNHTRPTGENK